MRLSPGVRLASYEILSLIGAGGMGEVYRARDTKLNRDVAFKVLPDEFALDADRLSRFMREAQVLAALNHPNIAHIHGVEESNGIRALVLELVDGNTLADRIAHGPLSVDDALGIASQIAEALEAAHERGIIHRDLKPANIKLRPDGVVKVLDFGLAKAPEHAHTADRSHAPTLTSPVMTGLGVILGTAAYMSPEQARGRDVDKRADIWAFGCVLYEMLTGRAIFARDTVTDTLAAIIDREPDWTALPAATPEPIRRLLRRCLDKDLKRRLRDIGDASAEVEDARSQRPSAAVAQPANRNQARQVWRSAALMALAAVVGAAGLTIWLTRVGRATVPPGVSAQTIVSQLTNYDGTETAGAIAPDGRSFVFVSNRGGESDIWLRQVSGGEPIRLTNDTAVESDLVFAPDGESIYFTRSAGADTSVWRIGALGGEPRKVVGDAGAPAVSADGRRLAWFTRSSDGSYSLVVGAIDGGERRVFVKDVQGVVGISPASWAPDGESLAYSASGLFAPRNLFVVGLTDGGIRQVTHFERSTEGPQAHAWLPDSRHLVISYFASTQPLGAADLGVLDSRTGSITRITTNVAEGFSAPSLSSDGTRLLVTASRPMREVWKAPFGADPLANGRNAVRLVDASLDPMWTFVTRDGRMLLFNNALVGSRNLWTMPLDGSADPRQITSMPGNAVMHSSLSPDGTSVAFASSTAGTSDIWVQSVDGSNLRQLTSDPAADSWPVWSPDGQHIIFASLRDGVWVTRRVSPAGGPPEDVVAGFFRGDWIAQADRTRTWIVSSMLAGGLRLLDGERRTVIWQDMQPGNALPVFSPDGKFVSLSYRETRDRDAIWVYEVATGNKRVAVRFPQQFHIMFRANWVDDGRAFVINRVETTSHIVLFDQFWTGGKASNQ
jgi:eukaryotic-like serine/threonine-protein kinase